MTATATFVNFIDMNCMVYLCINGTVYELDESVDVKLNNGINKYYYLVNGEHKCFPNKPIIDVDGVTYNYIDSDFELATIYPNDLDAAYNYALKHKDECLKYMTYAADNLNYLAITHILSYYPNNSENYNWYSKLLIDLCVINKKQNINNVISYYDSLINKGCKEYALINGLIYIDYGQIDKAARYLEIAYKSGSVEAAIELYEQQSDDKSNTKLREYLDFAASKGDLYAHLKLALNFKTIKSIEYFKNLLNIDDCEKRVVAYCCYGYVYCVDTLKNIDMGIDYIKKGIDIAKESGNSEYISCAYCYLGDMYDLKCNMTTESIQFHTIAADLGYIPSMMKLVNIYATKIKNPELFVKYTKMVIECDECNESNEYCNAIHYLTEYYMSVNNNELILYYFKLMCKEQQESWLNKIIQYYGNGWSVYYDYTYIKLYDNLAMELRLNVPIDIINVLFNCHYFHNKTNSFSDCNEDILLNYGQKLIEMKIDVGDVYYKLYKFYSKTNKDNTAEQYLLRSVENKFHRGIYKYCVLLLNNNRRNECMELLTEMPHTYKYNRIMRMLRA